MATEKKIQEWHEFDVETLEGKAEALHNDWRKADVLARAARTKMENAIISELEKNDQVPDDHSVAFSYRFGKISVGFDPTGRRPGESKTAKLGIVKSK